MFREGLLVVVSGPSGAGKGTLLKLLGERGNNIRFSVSATTRKPRYGEEEGKNYFFKTTDEFKEMIKNDELVEWVEYCDNFYGTPKKYIEDSLKQGYDVVLEIEVEGAANIRAKYPEGVFIFILPPSFKELRKRIEGRGTEKEDIINKRLEKAKKEILSVESYDYIVVNDDIEESVGRLEYILAAEKQRYKRNSNVLKSLGM